MQNIIISGHATSYPITSIIGDDTVTRIDVAVSNPRQADKPLIYRVECWNQLGFHVTDHVMPGDFIIVTAADLQVNPYINQEGQPDAELVLLALDVDCSQIQRSDDDYVGIFG
ncbi:MAG: hypothetical protein AAF846_26805 [Chloroflexota bacterium]